MIANSNIFALLINDGYLMNSTKQLTLVKKKKGYVMGENKPIKSRKADGG